MNDPDKDKLWKDTLESIRVSVSPAIFTTWFAQTHLASLKINNKRYSAEIGCSSSFVKSTIESRYFGLVQDQLNKALDTSCDVYFIVKDKPYKKDKNQN